MHCALRGSHRDIEVPSRVDGKRRYLARVSDFVSWDEACFSHDKKEKLTHFTVKLASYKVSQPNAACALVQ